MKPYIPRQITERLKELLEYFPCVVVIGARQVGKSTLLQHLFPDYEYVLFDPVVDIENARQDPDFFLENHPAPLILDEIQYSPEVIPTIKRRIDQNRKPGLYLVTGSQQWGVMKNLSESLAGRAAILELEPFSLGEIAIETPKQPWLESWLLDPEGFGFSDREALHLPKIPYDHIWRGFFPEAQPLPQNLVRDFHSSYQRTYVERDVRQMADISDLQQFTKFIRLVAALTAQEVNYHQIGRELGIDGGTAKRWLMILRETFEWHEIPAFSGNVVKRISSKPKGYFADTGQICYSQAIATPHHLPSHPLWGAIFENVVVNEVRKQCLWMATAPNLYHWRAYSGAECDLILEFNGKYYPVEIKAKTHPTPKDASGIKAFKKQYPHLQVEKGMIICLTPQPFYVTKDVVAMPWNVK